MAFQFSDAVRSAMVNAIPTLVGASPTLEIYSGTMPAKPATFAAAIAEIQKAEKIDYCAAFAMAGKLYPELYEAASVKA